MKLDDIEKLIEAATPGPWQHRDNCEVMTTEMLRHCVASCGPKRDFSFGNSSSTANAAFIAASRTLMPKLLKLAHTSISLDLLFYSGSAVGMSHQLDAWRKAMSELEQP